MSAMSIVTNEKRLTNKIEMFMIIAYPLKKSYQNNNIIENETFGESFNIAFR